MSDEKIEAEKLEVQRLLDAKVIREVKYSTWLANTVPVKKKNGKWRMCIDFTDLNKACPKDDFPLPRIDKTIDAAAGSELLSLLDCFSGYHQIYMKKEDEEKNKFHNTVWSVLLRKDARGSEKRRSQLLPYDKPSFRTTDWA